MRGSILFLIFCIGFACPAHAQGNFGMGAHIARSITYTIQIETRIGYLDCDLERQGREEPSIVGCAYEDGTEVSEEELVEIGLLEEPAENQEESEEAKPEDEEGN